MGTKNVIKGSMHFNFCLASSLLNTALDSSESISIGQVQCKFLLRLEQKPPISNFGKLACKLHKFHYFDLLCISVVTGNSFSLSMECSFNFRDFNWLISLPFAISGS